MNAVDFKQGKKEEGIGHLRRIAQMKEPEKPTDKASYYTALVLLGRCSLEKNP